MSLLISKKERFRHYTNPSLCDVECREVHTFQYEIIKRAARERNKTPKYQFLKYKYNARSRGLDFCIDYDVFMQLTESACYYCGRPPDECRIGLDRVDSDKGYVRENLLSCCSDCNYAKQSLSLDEFIRLVKLIAARF